MTGTVVITISDSVSEGTRVDLSGDAAEELLADFGPVQRDLVPDERAAISSALRRWAEQVDLVVTTGGTGLGPRDVTPEATGDVIERAAPGLAELMRHAGFRKTPLAALSRGVAGIAGGCLIVNLPGSPRAVRENLEALLPVLGHALETVRGRTAHRSGPADEG